MSDVFSGSRSGVRVVPDHGIVAVRLGFLGASFSEADDVTRRRNNPALTRKARVEKRVGKALKKYVRGNPEAEAVERYREFHGSEPDEFVTVKKRIHFHRHLSGAGRLGVLEVLAIDEVHIVTLTKFKGTLLAFNEKKNQLFVEGGDQHVDLADFGINPREAHELETLGRVKFVDYETHKDHLGPEGGRAMYRHIFRTTNENGKHITLKIARYPDLIYRVLDEQLEFSGGSYTIIAEGIDK